MLNSPIKRPTPVGFFASAGRQRPGHACHSYCEQGLLITGAISVLNDMKNQVLSKQPGPLLDCWPRPAGLTCTTTALASQDSTLSWFRAFIFGGTEVGGLALDARDSSPK